MNNKGNAERAQQSAARPNFAVPGKSRRSSKAIDRPFAADVLALAGTAGQQYQVILDSEGRGWHGQGLALPHVFADRKTPAQCVANTHEALTTAVATLLAREINHPRRPFRLRPWTGPLHGS